MELSPGFMPSVEVSALPSDMGLNERLIVCLFYCIVKMSLGKLDSVRNVLDMSVWPLMTTMQY